MALDILPFNMNKEDKMKISVIVPIYNSEKYLNKCIESLLNQEYKNLEIILVNDGSTDYSESICKSYMLKNKNIKYFYQQNSGVSSARNLGLANSSGDYIAFVDSDDYIEKDMFMKMVSEMKNNDCNVVVCNLFFEDATGKEIESFSHCNYIVDKVNIPYEMYTNLSFQGFSCNKLYKADLIKEHSINFAEGYAVLEDDLFNYDIVFKNNDVRVNYINDKLYHYVMLNTGVSKSKFSVKKLSYLDVRIREIEYLASNNIEYDFLLADYICVYNRMLYLSKKKNLYSESLFFKYTERYKEYLKKLKFKNLSNKVKLKVIIIRYFKFIYLLKMKINDEI